MDSVSIKDLMCTRFATIHPEMPVVEASSNLIKLDMLGSPVTDGDGTLVGWISERECLQAALQVGSTISAAVVDSVEQGFHEEHLELQQAEVDGATAHGLWGQPEDDTGETVPWVE